MKPENSSASFFRLSAEPGGIPASSTLKDKTASLQYPFRDIRLAVLYSIAVKLDNDSIWFGLSCFNMYFQDVWYTRYRPCASQSIGYMEIAVNPGSVFSSLKTGPSFVRKKSTLARE